MELNLKNIQQLNSQQILEIIKPMVNNLYKLIDYVGITKENYYDLILKEIKKSKKNYTGDVAYMDYIKNKINAIIFKKIKKQLLETETAIIIINNYINKYFKISNEYNENLKNLKKLSTFLQGYDYIPTPDVLIQIVEKNILFSKTIESIVKKNQKQIVSGNLEQIFDDSIIILIIETYCLLNNIEIKESKELKEDTNDIDSYKLINSVKMYFQEISKIPLLSLEEEKNSFGKYRKVILMQKKYLLKVI